jgi:protocatechuate 3,4-dioxygenase beta subunit
MGSSITRRHALAAFGAAGIGAVLAACRSDDGVGSAASSTTTSTTAAGTSTSATATAAAAGTNGLAARFATATSCTLSTKLTEGPYYIDVDSLRRDIREGKPGQLLRVGIRVLDQSCRPIPNALVEIWHCDAVGTYSGFEAASAGGRSSGMDATRYLRGGQVADADGIAEFVTVYPGWYRGRTVHIHAKAHVNNREVLTSQLFFDEAVTTEVYKQQPYTSDTGRDTFNRNDNIFSDRMVLTTTKESDGYLGLINFVVAAT